MTPDSQMKGHSPGLGERNICFRVPLIFNIISRLTVFPNEANGFPCTINYDLSKSIAV